MLRDAVSILKKHNFLITMLSPADGPVRVDFERLGCGIVLDGQPSVSFLKGFDLVLVNTMLWETQIKRLAECGRPLLWWIHEIRAGIESLVGFMPEVRDILANPPENVHIFASMEYNQRVLYEYCGFRHRILHFGLEDKRDVFNDGQEKAHDKIRFFLPANFDWAKGQDLLIDAVRMLSDKTREKCVFIFTGSRRTPDNEYWRCVERAGEEMPGTVLIFPELSRDQVYAAYTMMDCVLSPSRDDATPSVIVEGMMFEKLCICSDRCGIADFMMDGYNGLVFESGNAEELAARLDFAVKRFRELDCVRKRGREVYDSLYRLDVFEENLMRAVNGVLA